MEVAKKLNQEGTIPFAGAMIEDFVPDGQTPQFKGSVIVLTTDSPEQARKILESDIYNASQVWDMSKAQIIPFKVAFWSTPSGKAV